MNTYKIKKYLKLPYDAIKSSIICIRFPFLYPRNVWTDKHYNNWKLWNYHKDNWDKAYEWNTFKINKDNSNIPGCWEVKNKWLAFKIKCADFLNDFLGIFHFIPTYTLYEDIPSGWRKCFGKQMCKEIKKALLKDGGRKKLRKYRIQQIKEKFGALQWYDMGGNETVDKITNKYEYISYRTCIICGEPADYITHGWICPYCKNHIGDRKADEFFYDMDFYGWKKYKPEKKEKTEE